MLLFEKKDVFQVETFVLNPVKLGHPTIEITFKVS